MREGEAVWKSDLGNGQYRNPILYTDYSDPDAIRVGNDYYMVASSFSNAPGLPLLHSYDCVNWKLINYCIDRIPEFRYRNPIHGCGVWAPSIRYHEGTYYVCFPMPDEGIYMTTATDPYGKWSAPVNIRPGAGWIDPCPFWDDDGRAYLVAGVAKSRIGYKSVLHMVELQPDGMGLIGEDIKIFDGNENDQITIEGPKMYKRNGWYYIFAPAGGVKTGWQTVLRSRAPFGPYEYRVVMRQGSSPVNGPHQGAWVDTVTGQDWFIHFQDVYAAGRITHLQPMHWENDWPVIGIAPDTTEEIQLNYGEPVMEFEKPDVGSAESFSSQDNSASEAVSNFASEPILKSEPATSLSDFFNSGRLSLQWQWNSNYEDDWYELAHTGLKLFAVPASPLRPLGDTRNILLQKWQEPEFSCVTKLNISDIKEGDTFGYISLGTTYSAVTFVKKTDTTDIYHTIGTQDFDCDTPYTNEAVTRVGSLAADCDTVYVRYNVRQTGVADCIESGITVKNVPISETSIEISTDGVHFTSPLTAEAKAGRWVGVKHGFFIRHDSTVKSASGTVTVEYVKFI